MAYNSNATSNLNHRTDNLSDWVIADPGQWFIGVIDTSKKNVYVVPVNVFEGRGALNQETLNNTNQRAINRYASGAHISAFGRMVPYERMGIQRAFASFGKQNWLESRVRGETHHAKVARHYGSADTDCLGFTLIKVAPKYFAQMKCASNSLNMKPYAELNGDDVATQLHSFARATMSGQAYEPGSWQMPRSWSNKLLEYFRGKPFNLRHLVRSND